MRIPREHTDTRQPTPVRSAFANTGYSPWPLYQGSGKTGSCEGHPGTTRSRGIRRGRGGDEVVGNGRIVGITQSGTIGRKKGGGARPLEPIADARPAQGWAPLKEAVGNPSRHPRTPLQTTPVRRAFAPHRLPALATLPGSGGRRVHAQVRGRPILNPMVGIVG